VRKASRTPRFPKTLDGGKYTGLFAVAERDMSKPKQFLYWKGLVHEVFVAWRRYCFELGPDVAATIQKSKLERCDGMPIY
jgi:hypothetical protein